ncbi:unnamed protein product [Amoebophrya sp. A120]|nr:unnamed protein product [Amoebophrya sp. A120]|eukprot:GSA120T00010601001.1
MGQGHSSHDSAGVFIELDEYSVYPGSVLRGRIHVNVTNQVTQLKSLSLKLTGYEETSWRTVHVRRQRKDRNNNDNFGTNREHGLYQDNFNQDHPQGRDRDFGGDEASKFKNISDEYEEIEEIKHHDGRHDFFKLTRPVSNGGAFLSCGQYSFPFEVYLPDDLPGSCTVGRHPKFDPHLRHNEKYFHAMCKYKIKAFLEIVKNPEDRSWFSSREKTVKCSQEFQIINRCPPARACLKQMSTEIKICGCCCSKGTCDVCVQMGQDAFRIGDQIQVLAKFDNSNTTAELNELRLTLHRVIQLRSTNTNEQYNERKMICQDVKPGCPAGITKEEMFYMTLPGQTTERGNYNYDNGADSNVVPTCQGGLVQVYYELEVRGSVTCANDPVVSLPVFIYSTPPVYMRPQIADWKPQVFQVTVVSDIPCQMGFVNVPTQQTMQPVGGIGYGTMNQPAMVPQQTTGMVPQQSYNYPNLYHQQASLGNNNPELQPLIPSNSADFAGR